MVILILKYGHDKFENVKYTSSKKGILHMSGKNNAKKAAPEYGTAF